MVRAVHIAPSRRPNRIAARLEGDTAPDLRGQGQQALALKKVELSQALQVADGRRQVGDVAAVRDLGTNVEPIRVSDGRGTKVRTTCGEDR